MGRSCQTQPPVPIEFIRECFDLRDGVLIGGSVPKRISNIDPMTGRAGTTCTLATSGFAGPDGRLMARLQFEGATRRIAATRIAWAWRDRRVAARSGQAEKRRRGRPAPGEFDHHPARREPGRYRRVELEAQARAVDGKLIAALAVCSARDGPVTVAEIGELAGLTESGASARLGRLAAQGIATSPMCVPVGVGV